ncbi:MULTISPECIES: MFS transporter [Halorussus]|uniref:MFS transporter n=1 Tax=Halorussus TaxID=1070314 RepID=UPI00209F806C|nr:MFS transporter [Halorussus vallis]USZ76821.1 MFS transporter [Halorussus vallis]
MVGDADTPSDDRPPSRGRLPWRARLPSRAVATYYAYVLSRSLAFTMPIYVVFFRSRGLSLAQFGLLEATYTLAVLGLEFPTGYVADRLGRRNGLLASNALSALGAVGYALAHSFPAFLAAMVLRAAGATFSSGTSAAWLYEALADDDEEGDFARVDGRARALGLAGQSAAAVAGAWAYSASHLLPWALDVAALAAGGAVLLAVPAREDAPTATDDDSERLTPAETVTVVRTALAQSGLRTFVAYTSLFLGVVGAALLFVQPVSVDVLGVAPAHLGYLYAGLTLLSAAAAALAGRVRDRVGVDRWFGVVPFLAAAGLLAVLAVPWLALALFFVLRAAGAVSRPLADQRINDGVRSRGRATTLSAVSMLRSVAVAPLKLLAGAVAAAALPAVLSALGAVLLVGAVGLWLRGRLLGESRSNECDSPGVDAPERR